MHFKGKLALTAIATCGIIGLLNAPADAGVDPQAGYQFDEWYDDNGETESVSSPFHGMAPDCGKLINHNYDDFSCYTAYTSGWFDNPVQGKSAVEAQNPGIQAVAETNGTTLNQWFRSGYEANCLNMLWVTQKVAEKLQYDPIADPQYYCYAWQVKTQSAP